MKKIIIITAILVLLILVLSAIPFYLRYYKEQSLIKKQLLAIQKAKDNALSKIIETNPRGDSLLVNKPEYRIIYFQKEDQFLISILKSPFEEVRRQAEEEFLKITQADKKILCQLNVIISTSFSANPDFAGQKLPLSFCQK